MPSTSKKQHNFMAAVANNPAFAKKTGVSQSVGQEYMAADKVAKPRKTATRADLQKINRAKTDHGKSSMFSKGGATRAAGVAKKGFAPPKMMKKGGKCA